MSMRATPSWVLTRQDDKCVVKLVGYRGGLKHTYSRRDIPYDYTRAQLVEAILEMQREQFPDTFPVEEV